MPIIFVFLILFIQLFFKRRFYMKNVLKNKNDFIGDEGAYASVVKLRESISELYGVKKGISMPVVKFEFHNSFIFNEVRNDC